MLMNHVWLGEKLHNTDNTAAAQTIYVRHEAVPIVFRFRVLRHSMIPVHLTNNCLTIGTFRHYSVVDKLGVNARGFFAVYVSSGFSQFRYVLYVSSGPWRESPGVIPREPHYFINLTAYSRHIFK